MNYQIKTADLKEIMFMLDWAAKEGWNPGLKDATAFSVIDSQGFFIGLLNGMPVGCISNVKYSDSFAFLGLYIMQPKYRGQGFGYKLWQHAINYGQSCNIGLDGVVAQQKNYQKSGFHLAHRNIRYVHEKKSADFSHPHLQFAAKIPIQLILNYDRAFFPCPRDKFLSMWLTMKNATTLVYFDQTIKGYGVIRQCRQGYKIGPLFAENIEIARIIFQGLVGNKSPIYLDIPEINLNAKKLVIEFSMQPVFETARMYTQQAPDISMDRTYGITTFEVG